MWFTFYKAAFYELNTVHKTHCGTKDSKILIYFPELVLIGKNEVKLFCSWQEFLTGKNRNGIVNEQTLQKLLKKLLIQVSLFKLLKPVFSPD